MINFSFRLVSELASTRKDFSCSTHFILSTKCEQRDTIRILYILKTSHYTCICIDTISLGSVS